jgi:hypothetical protein
MRPNKVFSRFEPTVSRKDIEEFASKNPEVWKELTKHYDVGHQIITVQLMNGLDRLNENVLRNYLQDYSRRFLTAGPRSLPTSFNVLESFFAYNVKNSVLQLIDQEESYGLSLFDFVDFITSKNFDFNSIDLYNNIPENLIHHFSFTSGFDEINFSTDKGKLFYISSLSLVRQGNEVSILMQAGESYDPKEAEEYFKDKTFESVRDSISPKKKALGFDLEDYNESPRVVHLEEREDLWLHTVSMLFDLETRSIDIRHVGRDENISYSIFTDDFYALFSGQDHMSKAEIADYFESQLKGLSAYDAVFDFAKYCLALPYYIFENEDKVVDVTYETSLNALIKGPISKRKFSLVPNQYKIFAKPFYYVESANQKILKNQTLDDTNFKIEHSGYWKRIGIDEEGLDKKGRHILGKTWVERSDVYFQSAKGVTKVSEMQLYDDENAGYIYIMRQPAHNPNIFKIGLSTRNPKERSKELSNTSAADKFFILTEFHTKDCFLAEKLIHKELDSYRLTSRREFFQCDLRIILDVSERIIKDINR